MVYHNEHGGRVMGRIEHKDTVSAGAGAAGAVFASSVKVLPRLDWPPRFGQAPHQRQLMPTCAGPCSSHLEHIEDGKYRWWDAHAVIADLISVSVAIVYCAQAIGYRRLGGIVGVRLVLVAPPGLA